MPRLAPEADPPLPPDVPSQDLTSISLTTTERPRKRANRLTLCSLGTSTFRTQQRNGRKSLTTIQGINPKINKKVILKECKKKFNCNGTIVDDPELGQVIQLQGDQRKLVAQFLIDEKIAKKDVIKVHGS